MAKKKKSGRQATAAAEPDSGSDAEIDVKKKRKTRSSGKNQGKWANLGKLPLNYYDKIRYLFSVSILYN